MKNEYTLKFLGKNNWSFTWIDDKGNSKSISMQWDSLPKELDGKTVIAIEFNSSNNRPSKIECDGTPYVRSIPTPPPAQPVSDRNHGRNQGRNNGGNNGNNTRMQAPYNFITLNSKVVSSKTHGNNFDKFEGLSGYIDLEFENLTNIFIKGKDTEFFKAGNKYALPGSSLRGLLRQLVEMVSWGKMISFTDYKMSERINNNGQDKKMGFLFYDKINDNFQIRPAKETPESIPKPNDLKNFTYKRDEIDPAFVYIITKTIGISRHFRVLYQCEEHSFTLDKDSVAVYNYKKDETRNAEGEMKDVLDSSMKSNNSLKEQFGNQYIGIPIWYKAVGDKIVSFGHCRNYRVPFKNSIKDGIHQDGDIKNIVDFAESMFGSADKDKQSAGKIYVHDLIASDVKIQEAILQILSNPYPKNKDLYLRVGTSWDNNPQIRGFKQYWHRDTEKHYDPVDVENKLFTPDIEQVNFNKTKFRKKEEYLKFKPYNDHGFWVNNLMKTKGQKQEFTFTKTLQATRNLAINDEIRPKITNEANKFQFKIVNSIEPGAKFEGRIRFVNLTEEELGALLFILNLPGKCCYKMGTGKPIGLGSLRLNKTSFTLIHRKKRYASILTDTGNWALAEEKKETTNTYIEKFESYMVQAINHKGKLWEQERMKELKAMLTYRDDVDNEAWLKRTNYMSLDGFKDAKQPLNDPITISITK